MQVVLKSFLIGSLFCLLTYLTYTTSTGNGHQLVVNQNLSKSLNDECRDNQQMAYQESHTNKLAIKFSKENPTWYADIDYGFIGTMDGKPVDNAFDNIFHVQIPYLPSQNVNAILTYELFGVANHESIARSINESQAIGGHFVTLKKAWSEQKEIIPLSLLQQGDNVIRFSLPANARYHYEIRKVGIQLEKNVYSKPTIILNESALKIYEQYAYIKGFIAYPGRDKINSSDPIQLTFGDQKIAIYNNEFEAILPTSDNKSLPNKLVFRYAGGDAVTKELAFTQNQIADQIYTAEEKGKINKNLYETSKSFRLDLGESSTTAVILIPSKALPYNKEISITALRQVDLPILNPDMINVTRGSNGFRFLPHGTNFIKKAGIHLPYDSTLIPEGYNAFDIRTYFFDDRAREWKALPLDSIDLVENKVVSQTAHFTDMINGIIKVPESPETQGYTPTSIKDLKPADASTGIELIAPPTANSHGSATVVFELKIPSGRMGMQPDLAIQYNSSAGNGWLGLGWDLSIPFVSIDTRWGVPRYDSLLESETYLMNGEQLSPNANRGVFDIRKKSDKEFYPRVEKNFDKIIRHGTKPSDYWWEVTNKQGIRNFYGGLPGKGVIDTSVLRDQNKNISHWALVQTRDLDLNCVHYSYSKVEDPGVANGSQGQQLYFNKISYTGRLTQDGPYTIQFIRDRQLKVPLRKDVIIDGRYGYKMVTADLLHKINVNLGDQRIRSYDLKYKQGAFYKTLLDSISELDDKGDLFYAHAFTYFDDVNTNSGFIPLGEERAWHVGIDNIKGGIVNPITGFTDQTSALSTEKSTSGGFGLALTVGFTGDAWSKQFTVGGSFEFDHTSNEGAVCMIDINGDDLPDKVFKRNDSLLYRPNIKGTATFGQPRMIRGEINQFSAGTALNFAGGLQVVLFGGAFLGYNHASTTSKTNTYFTDFNGDGLIDIAANGQVYFNHLDSNGDPVFERSSTQTPVPLFLGNNLDKTFLAPDTALLHRQEKEFPLQDIIRFWSAPFDGDIRIHAPVTLIKQQDSLSAKKDSILAKKTDGVRVSVQLRDKILWNTAIVKSDFNTKTPVGLDNLRVKKGDRVYFRVQSVYNGDHDEVHWDPSIDYVSNVQPEIDANSKKSAHYKASEDFVISGAQPLGIPKTGIINISGSFDKSVTSDTVVLKIIRQDTLGKRSVLLNKAYPPKITVHGIAENIEQPVQKGDALLFEVHADSYIDRTAVHWSPSYIISYANGSTNGRDTLQGTVVPANNDYNHWLIPTKVHFKNKSDELRLYPDLRFNSDSSGQVTFTIKGLDTLYTKRIIQVTKGKVVTPPDTILLNVPIGTILFPEFHIPNEALALALQNLHIIGKKDTTYVERDTTFKDSIVFKTVNKVILDTLQAGLYTNSSMEQPATIFRRWGQFTFTGDKGNGPLDESKLNFKELESIDYKKIFSDTARYRQDRNTVREIKNPSKSDFAPLYGNGIKKQWVGRDSAVFVSATTMSSSRLMMHDVSVDSLMFTTGSSLTAVDKIEQSEANTLAAGVIISISYSHTETTNMLDMMDINGDSYPDVLHIDDVQYTLPTGGLEKTGRKNALRVTSTSADSEGLNLGGKFPSATATNKRNSTASNANNNKTKSNARNAIETASNSIGLSANVGFNQQSANTAWIDINGDGLPDKVYQDGKVALNLGYKFTEPEQWNFNTIDETRSTNFGAGIGVNILAGTIEAGIGMTRSEDITNTVLLDINGDGLPDKIITDGELRVQINTGNGFEKAVSWRGLNKINQTLTTGESFNVAFTIPINIFIIGLKICINPSFNLGHGVSGQTDQILDIDGDGFPDLVHSDNESNLTVRSSNIGRTNMLREVRRPLGSSFSMNYEQLGGTYNMPQNQWALNELSVYDGVPGDGADTMRLKYGYVGGHYDRREREFYGFDTVTTYHLNTETNNSTYRVDEEIYSNENYYIKGSLKSQTRLDAQGNKYTQNVNTYELKFFHDSVAYPALIQSKNIVYEGQATAGASTYTQYDYNNLGNIIKISDIGDGSQGDLLIANIKYHDNDSLYIKDIPAEIQVSTVEGIKRKRTTKIDTRGHITQINQFLTNETAAIFNMEYDTYGNLSKLQRPANYKNQRMFYQYTYDTIIHNRIVKTTDAYGYSDSMVYEYRFGNVISTTSMQNEQIKFNIDNRGRINSVIGPYELAAGKPYSIAFEYQPDAKVPYAITHHYDPEYNSDIDIITFMDGFSRAIAVKKLGSIFKGKNQEDELRMIVSGGTIYDAFGRTVKTYYPTTEPLSTANTILSTDLGKINELISYDILDRVNKRVLADGVTDSMHYSAIDNLTITQMIDGLGNKTEKYNDVRSRQKLFKQYGGPDGIITTSYFYNALSELVSVEDNNKNKLINTYDNLGRRLNILHPDAGLTEYNYDLSNNLLQKITPEIRKKIPSGGAVKYEYDYNRIIGIVYPIQYQNKVSYAYGAPGSGDRTGRLTLIKDASGGKELYYGKLGEVTKEIRTVLANTVFYTTYVSEQEFDTWNRIKKMTYPDGEVVSYHYNRAGGLKNIDGKKAGNDYPYVSKIGYNEFEEKVYLKYSNGTEMNYAYDDQRHRLQLLQATSASGNQMINNSYQYDPVSNITGILNNTSPIQGKLGGRTNQKYVYDNLYRLISATGNYEGFKDTASYGLNMAYDNLYNITNKKLVKKDSSGSYTQSYIYSGATPHQPSQIGNNKCLYDLNGNLTVYGNAEYFWDEENRMTAAIDNGILSEYTYDAIGERVIKSSGGRQGTWLNGASAGTINHRDNYTIYVSPYLVSRKNSFTKHIYIGSDRIISKIGDGSFTNISFPSSALTAGGINYIQRANQLKQDRVNYYAGLGVSPGPPTNKLYFAEPQNNGIAAPVLIDSTSANSPPTGWPGNTTKPVNGPPVYVATIPSNDSVRAGYGFKSSGHIYESNQYFFQTDHLGSSSYLTNKVGEAVHHMEYSAFGETFFEERTNTTNANHYLYSSKELDDETGLYYYGARYYNPVSSQWISADPLLENPNISPYSYVKYNPLIYIDPTGRIVVKIRYIRLPEEDEEDGSIAEEAMSYREETIGDKEYNVVVFEFHKGKKVTQISAHSGEGHGHSEPTALFVARDKGLVSYKKVKNKHVFTLTKGVTLPRIYTDRDACITCGPLIERLVGKDKNTTRVISIVSYGDTEDMEIGGKERVLAENKSSRGGKRQKGTFKSEILDRGQGSDVTKPSTSKKARIVPPKKSN